jgi:hypothetical protein
MQPKERTEVVLDQTNSMAQRCCREAKIIAQLVNKFPAFYGTRRFNPVRINGVLASVHRTLPFHLRTETLFSERCVLLRVIDDVHVQKSSYANCNINHHNPT